MIDVNTWVWTSPLADADIPALAPEGGAMGFDLLELPLETLDGYDRAGPGGARSGGAALLDAQCFPPDRDLTHHDASPSARTASSYITQAIKMLQELRLPDAAGPDVLGRRQRAARRRTRRRRSGTWR